uniref:Uncharacterized protein n=1 Tax=Cryptomonas curvata TaxID=233186 RepID=A0A6T8AAK2_9CRYP|mmetsp:Transcript_44280/g.92587  ORF Transcript_44280/g.92587 Transcript_44280/m.92587 type:complete len:135 (+) Transcript_44280:217-621(+)
MSSWSPASYTSGWTGLTSQGLSGALSVASGVVSAVSSSVPAHWVSSGVKSCIGNEPAWTGAAAAAAGRDRVLWAGFDCDDGAPSHPQFLCVCFANGFQIWRVLDAADDAAEAGGAWGAAGSVATRETQPLREVA